MLDPVLGSHIVWANEHANACVVSIVREDLQREANRLLRDPQTTDTELSVLRGCIAEWDYNGDDEAEQCNCGKAGQ